MTTAAAIADRMKQTGRKPGPGSILTVVMDVHNVHCLTESHLDTWWHSLAPAEKADVFEIHLGDPAQPTHHPLAGTTGTFFTSEDGHAIR